MNVNTIKEASLAAGSHWFEPDTMEQFGTTVLPTCFSGPGGIYFVTRDKDYAGQYGHTVRRFTPETAVVDTVGEVAGTRSVKAARLKARNLARAAGELRDVVQTAEKYRPVSVLDKLLRDLRRHGDPGATAEAARKLVKAAYRHHHYTEEACNSAEGVAFAQRNTPGVEKIIRRLATEVGATGVVFSGDPRGVTVKLTFADGYTNDFGGEGYCVPTDM